MRPRGGMPWTALGAAMLALSACGQSDDEADPTVTVEAARVVRADLVDWLQVYGNAVAPPVGGGSSGGTVQLAAPAATIVRALPVQEGQNVRAGALIARLDDRVASAQLAEANATLRVARERLTRQSKLLAVGGIAANTVEDARQQVALAQAGVAVARDSVSRGWITSPISGTVTHIYVRSGQAVDAGAPIADVVNGGAVGISASVPVADISRVRVGQLVQVTGPGIPTPLTGRVDYVGPTADPNNSAVPVRAQVFAQGQLRQGQSVSIRIDTAEHAGALVVPTAAVYTDAEGSSSVAIVRNGVARRVKVRRGLEDGERLEIVGPGIGVGTVVVTTGSYALEDGTHVHVAGTPTATEHP